MINLNFMELNSYMKDDPCGLGKLFMVLDCKLFIFYVEDMPLIRKNNK